MSSLSNIGISTESLPKYLTTLGSLMIAFAFVYPIEKENEIRVEINSLELQKELLDARTVQLDDFIAALRVDIHEAKSTLDDAKTKLDHDQKKAKLDLIINPKIDLVKHKENELTEAAITIKWGVSKVDILKKQARVFYIYGQWLLWPGIVFFVVGFVWWLILTIKLSSKGTI